MTAATLDHGGRLATNYGEAKMTETEYRQAKNAIYLDIAVNALEEIVVGVTPSISDKELIKIRDTLRRWFYDAHGEMGVDSSDW